jgi:hypothetical protein
VVVSAEHHHAYGYAIAESRRTRQPHHANAPAPVHSANEWSLEKVGKPPARHRAQFRVLQSLQDSIYTRVTPAMQAGIDDHVQSMKEMVMMADTMD